MEVSDDDIDISPSTSDDPSCSRKAGNRWRMAEKSPPNLYFKKHRKGSALKSGEKQIVLNVYARLSEWNPCMTKEDIASQTAQLTGVSVKSLYRMRKERHHGNLRTQGKQHPRLKGRKLRMERMDDLHKVALRRLVHSFFRKNESPNFTMVKTAIDKEIGMPHMSRESIRLTLLDLGFKYNKRKSCLSEKYEIQLRRVKYLREIKKCRDQKKEIYYLGETCINFGHAASKQCDDTSTRKSKYIAGLPEPNDRGGRFIIFHIGNDKGFLEGGLYYCQGSKQEQDYHREIDGDTFEAWFCKIFRKLPENSIIVMDSSPYHCVKATKIPTLAWRKDDIIEWLKERSISYPEEAFKVELVDIARRMKHQFEGYTVDAMTSAAGHTVLRLPPYHSELNPIEMAWNQVKEHVALKNTSFKSAEMEALLIQGVLSVTPAHWKTYCEHVQKLEEEWWDTQLIYEEHSEMVLCVNSTSEEENFSSPDDDDSDQEDSDGLNMNGTEPFFS